ncbi:MAG: flagellar biosynthetic protein FliO [Deltaproteobacteria bacterium]|jgi:flagellar biosynthetic protein FliO|nr:flagellar biosynthetic protein FliO [Desulfobacterales bacterium]MDL1983699.1 flagellar biosynthetic protein FliO [Deltaproteobacteria bacterium]
MNYHPDLLSTVLKMITALVIVLGGLFIVFYFLRRILKREVGGSSEKLIRVLASSYIGAKKNISLIEVPGSILVLGVTSDNICLLTKIEDEEILNRFKRPEEKKRSTSFSDQLNKLCSRSRLET